MIDPTTPMPARMHPAHDAQRAAHAVAVPPSAIIPARGHPNAAWPEILVAPVGQNDPVNPPDIRQNDARAAAPRHALRRLMEAGILYAPDYVINAGGIINVSIEVDGPYDPDRSRKKVENIYFALKRVFEIAHKNGTSTNEASNHVAEERLAEGRRQARSSSPA